MRATRFSTRSLTSIAHLIKSGESPIFAGRSRNALDLAVSSDEELETAQRLHEESNQGSETEHARMTNPLREARFALHRLTDQLWMTLDDLRECESFINADVLIVTGEAGTGKTHLLCDVAENRIKQKLPTVILMGQRFRSREDPWRQVLDQIDLSSISADVFVGALEAAAQAADCRALVMIDAINEGEGGAIWRAHLAPFSCEATAVSVDRGRAFCKDALLETGNRPRGS